MKKIRTFNKEEKLLEKFLKLIVKLPYEQYFGVARILNVDFMETMEREEILEEIKTIKEELEKIKTQKEVESKEEVKFEERVRSEEDSAPDRKEDHEEEINSNREIDPNKEIDSAPSHLSKVEAMEKRLEKLEEEKDKEEITIKKFRTGEDIMEATIQKFTELSNGKKKNLLTILKAGAY